MSDKAVKRETEKLKEQIQTIEFRKNTEDEIKRIYQYNAIVFGIIILNDNIFSKNIKR